MTTIHRFRRVRSALALTACLLGVSLAGCGSDASVATEPLGNGVSAGSTRTTADLQVLSGSAETASVLCADFAAALTDHFGDRSWHEDSNKVVDEELYCVLEPSPDDAEAEFRVLDIADLPQCSSLDDCAADLLQVDKTAGAEIIDVAGIKAVKSFDKSVPGGSVTFRLSTTRVVTFSYAGGRNALVLDDFIDAVETFLDSLGGSATPATNDSVESSIDDAASAEPATSDLVVESSIVRGYVAPIPVGISEADLAAVSAKFFALPEILNPVKITGPCPLLDRSNSAVAAYDQAFPDDLIWAGPSTLEFTDGDWTLECHGTASTLTLRTITNPKGAEGCEVAPAGTVSFGAFGSEDFSKIRFCAGEVRVNYLTSTTTNSHDEMLPLFEKIVPVIIQRFLAMPADVLSA
jgi:hypothetical protein